MHQVDFTFTEAKESKFSRCDLMNSIFNNTNLEKADFSTAFNFNINPAENNLKDAQFSKNNIEGLLNIFKIKIK
jgi:uncharacterized protein YjbI with pentapeptide repeats